MASFAIRKTAHVRVSRIKNSRSSPSRSTSAEAASALVERLGLEREFFIRETLTWAVLRIANDAMLYLHQALSSPRWLARLQALHVLSKMGRYEDADRLVPLIGDEVDAVASHAYWAAGH